MIRRAALPELLSPAGNYDCLVAAIVGGADAVYIGGERFGARAYAENFDTGAIKRAVTLCKLNGVRLYVTVNTLITDKEMADAVSYAIELYKLGVDALIVADVGLIREIRRALPNMELHASTQLSVHNTPGADEAYALGCARVVPARELSLENIRRVTRESKPEVEVFLHGALCVSHSGQCLFSSLVGGRSGNRGECAQPCRLPYTTACGKGYPLSLKDLSLASYIPELIESGVASLKIEGRMKSPEYVYTVTSIYRRLLDEGRAADESELLALRKAFSRDGFTDGYFTGKIDTGMTGVRSERDKQESKETKTPVPSLERTRVKAKVRIVPGEPASMTLILGERRVTATGDAPEEAESRPLTPEDVTERLCKMGNTCLSLSPSDIDLTLGEGLNVSPARLNALRREAAEMLENFGREYAGEYTYEKTDSKSNDGKADTIDFTNDGDTFGSRDGRANGTAVKLSCVKLSLPEKTRSEPRVTTAQFFSEEAYMAASDDALSAIDISFVPLFSSDDAISRAGAVFLPPVITDSELCAVREGLLRAVRLGASWALADNIGHLSLIREVGLRIFGGFRLNIYNRAASAEYKRLGAYLGILSPELTLPQARDISDGVVIYGRIPLMLTERCFIREGFGCDSCGKAALTDRMGEKFPIIREWGHRNLILNSEVTYMGDRPLELRKYGINHTHYLFTIENGYDIGRVISAIGESKPLDVSVRRVGRRDVSKSVEKPNAPRSVGDKVKTEVGRGKQSDIASGKRKQGGFKKTGETGRGKNASRRSATSSEESSIHQRQITKKKKK
ncbi:MAG: U32 family peptidase [Clostridia bacterium]|nr:U32 family peptidase [Clostridia bacterium]